MATTKITRKWQITIPAEIREKLDLEIGDSLQVSLDDNKIQLTKPVNIGLKTAGALAEYSNPNDPLTPDSIREAIAEYYAQEAEASLKTDT